MNSFNRSVACLLLSWSFTPVSLFSQVEALANYDWDPVARLHVLNDSDRVLSEIILKNYVALEFAFDSIDELTSYRLDHKIIRVGNDKGIEDNNKIYLQVGEGTTLLRVKARVILPDGRVRELREDAIKEGVFEKNQVKYKYFALEGLERGSEIEYYLLTEQPADIYGRNIVLQGGVPRRNVEFTILSPSNLKFAALSYNGFPPLVADVTKSNKNRLYAKLDSIPGIGEEQFAVHDANMMQVVYKLDENSYNNKKNIVNYINVSQTIYNLTHENPVKSVTAKIAKLIKGMDLGASDDEATKIRKIEKYLKNNFSVTELPTAPTELEKILDAKVTLKVGMTKLFCMILDQVGINYEVVLTCDRTDLKFDKTFESYNFLDEYLLYFPEVNMYTYPSSYFYRLGCIPFKYFNTYGLFVRTVALGDMKSGVGKVKFIEPTSYMDNGNDMIVDVHFGEDISTCEIDYLFRFSGLYASPIQPYYDVMSEENQKKMHENLMDQFAPETQLISIVTENNKAEFLGVKPLLLKAKVKSSVLVETAGEKYLLKVGMLIGPQQELYREKDRKLDIENDYNREYHRELTIPIPDGYTIKNMDPLRMSVAMVAKGDTTCAFVSNYEIKGKQLKVIIDEYYRKIYYPKSLYEEYRAVINASADFNKVVLVMEKE